MVGDELQRLINLAQAQDHCASLRAWLRDHKPKADWSADMRRAHADRELSLKRWVATAQRIQGTV